MTLLLSVGMAQQDQPDDLLTLAQVGRELGIDPSRLRRLAARGVLKARKLGKTWITTRKDMEAFARHERRPGWPGGRPRTRA